MFTEPQQCEVHRFCLEHDVELEACSDHAKEPLEFRHGQSGVLGDPWHFRERKP